MFPNLSTVSKRRRTLDLTQNELATKAEISQSLLTKIERGIVIPNYEIACRIFDALDESEYKDDKTLSDYMKSKVIFLKSTDTVSRAASLAKKHAVSQFPVLDNGHMVGAVTISMLIGQPKSKQMREIMKEPFPTLNGNTPVEMAKDLLKQYPALIILKSGAVAGIVTAEDII